MGTASEYTLRQLLYLLNGAGVWKQDGVSQILVYGVATNQLTLLYSVPVGQVAYLTSITVWAENSGAAVGSAGVIATLAYPPPAAVWGVSVAPGGYAQISVSFSVPIKLPQNWSVSLLSSAANLNAQACVTGVELPA